MSGSSDDGLTARAEAAIARLRGVGVVRVVVAIAVLALLARLVVLGARTAHFDEGRVAYWILHTIETGDFGYRRIIHGPLIQHVNHVLFPLLGASDLVMRVPVAVVGSLLPLTALLFREHLDDDETVVLALFLAANPVLLYYSRFMRSDVLVAAFMFAGLGFLVRFYDTRRFRYLYALGAAVALGFGSKENAAVYILTWVGATALLADQALYRARAHDSGLALLRSTWLPALWHRLRGALAWVGGSGSASLAAVRTALADARKSDTAAGRVARWLLHPLGVLAVFLAITVFLYAPRGGGETALFYYPSQPTDEVVGLYEALGNPTALPGLVVDTLADTADQYGEWFAQSSDPGCFKDNVIDGWLCYLGRYVEVMRDHALLVSLFGVLGFLYERYVRATSRNLVMFAGLVGFVSVLGYPLGTDVFGAWIVVHAVVPLAIPAAVAVARISRWGTEALAAGDGYGAAAVGVVLLLLAAQVTVVAVGGVYTNHSSDTNTLVQYSQPGDDLDPVQSAFRAAAADEGPGTDLVFYYGANGSDYNDRQALVKKNPARQPGDLLTEPACAKWFNALPLPWYYERAGVNASCTKRPSAVVAMAGDAPPAVIVATESDATVPGDRLRAAGYENRTFLLRAYGFRARVFVHERVGWDASGNS